MITGRATITYEDFIYIYGSDNRIERIKRLREKTTASLKEAKWLIDSCVGPMGQKYMKVVDPDGSEVEVTYPAAYVENVPYQRGETVLLEIIVGGSKFKLSHNKDDIYYFEDTRGETWSACIPDYERKLYNARQRAEEALKELQRANEELGKLLIGEAKVNKMLALAHSEGIIDFNVLR